MTNGVYGTSPVKRSRSTRAEIEELDAAIYEVCEEERPLSVRGCFYRVMSRGLIPKTEASYRRALWVDQGVHVELWVEKDAIASVVSVTTREWDIPIMVARGFPSESFLWSTSQDIVRGGKPAVVYQLGDHDASGVSAWEQTQRRLTEFVEDRVELTFERLAVTPEQIEDLDLPTRPQKKTDSRAANFAGDCVEVDAVPSTVLRSLVEDAIESWIDPEALRLTRIAEDSEREGLQALAQGGLIGGDR